MTANPTLLSMPLAQNGQKNVIPDTQATPGNGLFSQSTGFPAETSLPLGAGGVAPSREDFNGMANLLGGVAFYAQKGFTFNYDATQDYYTGCVVIDPIDGLRYECIADMAAGTIAPSADTAGDYWKEFGVDTSTLANTDLSNLTATGEARFSHVVIDSYYDSATGDWWRKYADGWVEQGSTKYIVSIASNLSVSLLLPMADDKYSIQANAVSTVAMGSGSGTVTYNTTVGNGAALNRCSSTGFYISYVSPSANDGFGNIVWRVCGMGASV